MINSFLTLFFILSCFPFHPKRPPLQFLKMCFSLLLSIWKHCILTLFEVNFLWETHFRHYILMLSFMHKSKMAANCHLGKYMYMLFSADKDVCNTTFQSAGTINSFTILFSYYEVTFMHQFKMATTGICKIYKLFVGTYRCVILRFKVYFA